MWPVATSPVAQPLVNLLRRSRISASSRSCIGSIVKRVTAVTAAAVVAFAAQAGPREQAKRMHDRIAGVPPSDVGAQRDGGRIARATISGGADRAMDHPAFYNVTLKNFVTPWTNRDQTVFAPLNDYTATVIGMVRDDVPFNDAAVRRHPLHRQLRVSACRRTPRPTTTTTRQLEDAAAST